MVGCQIVLAALLLFVFVLIIIGGVRQAADDSFESGMGTIVIGVIILVFITALLYGAGAFSQIGKSTNTSVEAEK